MLQELRHPEWWSKRAERRQCFLAYHDWEQENKNGVVHAEQDKAEQGWEADDGPNNAEADQ
eukprot:15260885-Alexandrium_andersonii.AAC.1